MKYILAPKSGLTKFLETYKANTDAKWDVKKMAKGDWLSEQ